MWNKRESPLRIEKRFEFEKYSKISNFVGKIEKLCKEKDIYPNISFEMQTMVNSLNKLLPVGKKVKKYLPFFIGFKLLTFTGFLTYIMNR